MGTEKPPSCNLGAFRVRLMLLSFATHSIAYSVVRVQAKPVEIEGFSRVGFEAVGAVDFGDERRYPQCLSIRGIVVQGSDERHAKELSVYRIADVPVFGKPISSSHHS